MAANYTVLSTHTTDELQGGTRLALVREIGAETIPSGVYFQARIDLSFNTPDEIAPILAVLADNIEVIAQDALVQAVVYIQDVNAAGQLIDVLEITYGPPDVDATGLIRVPLTTTVARDVLPEIGGLVDQLLAIQHL